MKPVPTVALIAVVVAVAVVVLVSGWADDRAKPGSTGRGGPVTSTPAERR